MAWLDTELFKTYSPGCQLTPTSTAIPESDAEDGFSHTFQNKVTHGVSPSVNVPMVSDDS